MNLKDLLPNDAELYNGQPVFTGTKVTMATLLDHLEAGDTLDEFLEDFPTVSRQQAMSMLKIIQNKLEM
jgi:uncharacterized protein (DUF433 family)